MFNPAAVTVVIKVANSISDFFPVPHTPGTAASSPPLPTELVLGSVS